MPGLKTTCRRKPVFCFMTLKEESITARKAWHGASRRKLADHIFIHRCETQRELEVGPGYKPSKPPPRDGHLSARLHQLRVLEPSQTVPPTGNQVFKPRSLCGMFLFQTTTDSIEHFSKLFFFPSTGRWSEGEDGGGGSQRWCGQGWEDDEGGR